MENILKKIIKRKAVGKIYSKAFYLFLLSCNIFGQSLSFQTFMNPVIPGDHPDCTLTKIGNDFYTTGSSFNITPVIYHSTDLVHWEVVAQPVSAAWTGYGDAPKGGCWGGQVVYHNNKYWHFFSRSNTMYFVTADDIKESWTMPTQMSCPSSVPGLGYDNSIFIDDDGSWYLLVKNGQVNNWIVQLGDNGQPKGAVYDLTWLNPPPSYPFSWAEGPVMWKYKSNYYYSFARNVAGGQKVFMSNTLTDTESSWVYLGDFFNLSDPLASSALFQSPNHSSAAVMIDDSTSWVIHPLWRNYNSNEWYGQGRQGLLNQVTYNSSGKPTADYPINNAKAAPKLPSSGIPWMVPHSDFFNSEKLNPEWSFSGYTAENTHSLTSRNGWLRLSPRNRKANTIVKNDGEHNYSLITKLDFDPQSTTDEAGIWIFNGLETYYAKLFSSVDSSGSKIIAFSFSSTIYKAANPADSTNNILFLKLVRINHKLSGYYSLNGNEWTQIGKTIDVEAMDGLQSDYNAWTGNRQGLFVKGSSADFDYYIYREAYTPIMAECPANQYGTATATTRSAAGVLTNIHDGDWVLYAGIEFGNNEYCKTSDSLTFTASSNSSDGAIEVWIDSLDSGNKIAECNIDNTGGGDVYKTFSTKLLQSVSGSHDVYLKFRGSGSDKLFSLQWITFTAKIDSTTSANDSESEQLYRKFYLEQNYPNPFNPATKIQYSIPNLKTNKQTILTTLKIYDVLGKEITTLVDKEQLPGVYEIVFNANRLTSGVYFYQLKADNFLQTKKLLLLK